MKFSSTARVCRALIFTVVLSSVISNYAEAQQAVASAGGPSPDYAEATKQELQLLREQLAEQKKELQELRMALSEQRKLIDRSAALSAVAEPVATPTTSRVRSLGEIASITPMIPNAPAAAAAPLAAPLASGIFQKDPQAQEPSPLSFRIGSAYVTPVGFMDFTAAIRSTNPGSGIGSNFGSIPFNNASAGHLTESRLSPQNSRIGFRVDAMVKGAKVIGYLESDFLGFVPTNAAVSSNSFSNRLRLYWVDVRKDKFEVLAGQSWSLMTPNRKGLGGLPGDLFYSQDIDVNYQVGLTWARQAGARFIYHPNETVAMGIALENQEQYIGGSAGGGAVTLPTNLVTPYANELNNGATTLNTPQLHPDIIAKVAFDPKLGSFPSLHVEVAGLFRSFKTYNLASHTAFVRQGYGGSLNIIAEPVKNFRLISTNFVSDGGGRYIFGQAPDVIVRGDGGISPVHADSTVDGVEATIKNTLLYSYYGGVYIGKNVAIDPANGKQVGYGFSGSGGGQNRSIQELTIGFNQTLWKSPQYGALNFMGQYSYLFREPWFVAPPNPKAAHANIVYLNLRYTLPGSAPTLK